LATHKTRTTLRRQDRRKKERYVSAHSEIYLNSKSKATRKKACSSWHNL
jgi:hypothetical protein